MITQGYLSGQVLLAKVKGVLKNIEKSKKKANLSKKLVIVDAAKILAQETLVLGSNHGVN